MQPIRSNMAQRTIIQHDHRIRILHQPSHRQHAIVRMHNHIARVRRIRKHRIRLYNLLGEPIVQPLEQKAAQTRSRSASNRVQHHEPFEGVTAVGLAVNHLHDILADGLTGLVAITPVVGGAHAIFTDVEVFGVVDVFVGAVLDAVYHLWKNEKDVLACVVAACEKHNKVLRIQASIRFWGAGTHSRLQVYENRSWNISRIVALVVKHVLAIASLGGKVFEIAILANAMLQAELLPELASNCGTRLSAQKSIRFNSQEE